MSHENRIRTLEESVPRDVVIRLKSGATFRDPRPPLQFCSAAMKEIQSGHGSILSAVLNSTQPGLRPDSGDKLLELMRAVMEPAAELQPAHNADNGPQVQ